MTKFPYDHIVKVPEQEVWVKCESAITAMGIGSVAKKFYPGYSVKICSENHLNTLRQTIQ